MLDQEPTFQARPVGIGGAWYVLVSWPDGRIEKVTGFASGALANRSDHQSGITALDSPDADDKRLNRPPASCLSFSWASTTAAGLRVAFQFD